MGHPTRGEVSVATTTLRSEATEWDAESDQVAALATKTSGMEFGRLEAGIFQLMVGPYETLVQVLTERCREGATAMADIADGLRGVADTYDAEDETAATRIHKTTN